MKIFKLFMVHRSLTIILILAAFLRLWHLSSVPPSLTPDEASLGVNAYTILQTGRDMWGETFPLIFKSFGDYTPGLYVYLTIPFVFLMGLSEWSVRLPNAILGIAIIWVMYLIMKEWSDEKSKVPILCALLAAINTWLIQFSRGAWLPNVCLALTLLGIYFFVRGFKRNLNFLLSSFFFISALLSYQGAKMSVVIVVSILTLLFYKKLITVNRKILAGSFILGVILSLPIFLSMITGHASRLSIVSVFSYPRSQEQVQQIANVGGESLGSMAFELFHSEPLNFTRVILGKWFNHFSSRFLFFEGDWENPRFSAPGGMLLLIDLILLPLGFLYLSKMSGKLKWFTLLWLITSPLPAILSRDQVHAARALNMVIPLIIISSFGLVYLINYIGSIKANLFPATSYALLFAAFILPFLYFLDAYFVHLPKHNAVYWDYGYKEVVSNLSTLPTDKTIVFQQSYEQPFVFFLFYNPAYRSKSPVYEPSEVGDVGFVTQLGNVTFQRLGWPFVYPKGTIIVVDEITAPENLVNEYYSIISEIKRPNNSVAYRILEAK